MREASVTARASDIALDAYNATVLRGRQAGVVVADRCRMLAGLDARGGAITLFGESETVVDAAGSVVRACVMTLCVCVHAASMICSVCHD